MEKEDFYLIGETKMGPMSLEAIKAAAITPDTLVWHNELTDWTKASNLPELQGTSTGAKPVTPQAATPYAQAAYTDNMSRPPMPDNYLVWAILCTVLCCLPLGIVSIISSTKVSAAYNVGDYVGAQKASDDAKKWAMWGAIGGFLFLAVYFIALFALGFWGILSDL